MFKFNGLKSLPQNLIRIDFTLLVFLDKTSYFFTYDFGEDPVVTSDRFYLSKRQFLEFHNEVEDKQTIPFSDYVYYYDERINK